MLIPESGYAEAYGHAVNNGIRLASNEAREGEGPARELPVSSRPTPVRGPIGRPMNSAVSPPTLEVELVVGGVTTDEALALIPVVEDEKVVCLSPSASASSLTGRSPYFFRLFATDEVEGSTAARYHPRHPVGADGACDHR